MSPESATTYFFFGGLLASFAALMAVFYFVVVLKKRALCSWAAAAATVTESGAVWGTGTKGGRTRVLLFKYQYEVGGAGLLGPPHALLQTVYGSLRAGAG